MKLKQGFFGFFCFSFTIIYVKLCFLNAICKCIERLYAGKYGPHTKVSNAIRMLLPSMFLTPEPQQDLQINETEPNYITEWALI